MASSTSAPEGLRERGKRRRVERILEAARELLRDDPARALTVERIAERADVSQGTVFNLIGTRERIWAALADSALGTLELGSIAGDREPQQRGRAIADAILNVVLRDPAVFRAVFSNWAESAQAIHSDPTAALRAALRDGVASGQLREDAPVRRLAEMVTAGLVGIIHQWAAGLISERALRTRGRDLVDFAFMAAERA